MAQLLIPGAILSMPIEAANRLLRADNGDAALLYLHLLRGGEASALKWPSARLNGALEVLSRLDMAPKIAPVAPPAPTLPADLPAPEYSSQDITEVLGEDGSPFTFIADEVERQLGKKLNATDLKSLFTLYDHLALPPEVILLLTTYCIGEHERKFGVGRRPFVSAIKKEGFVWARRGIETAERADEYLRQQDLLRSREGMILQVLDLPARPLVTRERDYVAQWQQMGFPDEVIRLGYEKTVMKKGSLDWSYLNGILRRWHEKGLHSLEKIQQGDKDTTQRAGQGAYRPPQPQQERVAARNDMDQLRRMMAQMKDKE